ncbi:LysR family transcriptional regulator [Aureimonas jatrophae]|nr:LysR substrate-binding domain-containing protein [Aureimonas jatrophae]
MRALEAFEAVSRHLSIARAADELGVTQSAVSHQLRALTEDMGERLFARSGRGIELTPAGRQLADRVQMAFRQIDQSVADVVGANRGTVRLAICSSFGPGWLVKRLASFLRDHEQIDLQLKMYASDPELTDAVADAFVTTLPKEQGFWSLRLRPELLIAVRSPHAEVRDGKPLPLITTTLDPSRIGDDWIAWCEIANVRLDDVHSGRWLQVSHYVTALEVARTGLGIALVPDFLAEEALAAGTLETLSDTKLPTHDDYYLCIKASRRSETNLRAVTRWFREQIGT